MNSDSLIPRPELLHSLAEALGRGSILLYGPRRVGKSTMLCQIEAAPPPNLRLVRLDLEGRLRDPVGELAEGLHRLLGEAGLLGSLDLGGRVDGVDVAGLGVHLRERETVAPWERVHHDLAEAVRGLRGGTLVVALDEVPWWIDALVEREGPVAGRAALASLRRLRQHGALGQHLRMVMTGSIGLAGLVSEIGASAEINDLDTILFPPMSPEEGAALFELEVIACGGPCSPEAAGYAAQMAGGSPHWIKSIAARCGRAGAADPSAVDAAVDRLLEPELRRLFSDEGHDHFRRRHRRVMPALLAMLESVSAQDTGNPPQAALNAAVQAQPDLRPGEVRECLHLLEDGFYLKPGSGDTLDWVIPLFRRWWLRYGGA